MAKKEVYPHADKLARYEKIVAGSKGIERKGATVPYTSINGNMFSYLDKDGNLNLRLPEADREYVMKKYKTGLTKAYGIVQKEYVVIPESALKDEKETKILFNKSVYYVSSLKAKPTKKLK
jgi:hypothetical protein